MVQAWGGIVEDFGGFEEGEGMVIEDESIRWSLTYIL